jgi:hypothetical protein
MSDEDSLRLALLRLHTHPRINSPFHRKDILTQIILTGRRLSRAIFESGVKKILESNGIKIRESRDDSIILSEICEITFLYEEDDIGARNFFRFTCGYEKHEFDDVHDMPRFMEIIEKNKNRIISQ